MTNPNRSSTPNDRPGTSPASASEKPGTDSPAKNSTEPTPKPAPRAPAKSATKPAAKSPTRRRAKPPAEPVSQTATSVATVTTFLQALERLDLEAALALLADDVLYQNVSLPPARGRHAVAKQLGLFIRHVTEFRAVNHRIVGDGATVLTERTDIVTVRRFRAEFWVCGSFEVRDGKIVLWRDYFDWANLFAGAAAGAGRALVGLARGLRNRRASRFT